MIHQVMLSGNIKSQNSAVINQEDIQRILEHVRSRKYTGLTLYSQGSFLTLYEGDKDLIENSRQQYNDTDRYSNITTMFSRKIKERSFPNFRIGLGRYDTSENIEALDGCFQLSPEVLDRISPASLPNEFKVLTLTFARVNNLLVG